MSGLDQLLVVLAGLDAGLLTSTVGVASLLSFPILLAGVAGSVGAVLLRALPPGVFEAVVPWLILGTCVLVGVQPCLSSWLAGRQASSGQSAARVMRSPLTTLFVLLTGVYGGYFGAGAGVMMIAILALGLDIDFRVVGALRTTSVMASNVVAGVVFAVVAEVDWAVVALLAVSSVGGGYLGARIAGACRPRCCGSQWSSPAEPPRWPCSSDYEHGRTGVLRSGLGRARHRDPAAVDAGRCGGGAASPARLSPR